MAALVLVALAWFCAALAAAGLAHEAINLTDLRRLQPRRGHADVVACIAMRNEELHAAGVVESLLLQPEVRAIVVCDDGSTDRTASLLAALAQRDSRVVIVKTHIGYAAHGSPKSRALAEAAEVAAAFEPEYFFFTDADVRLLPGAVGSLAGFARDRGVHVASAWPRVSAQTLWDHLLSPVLVLFLLQALPVRATRGRDPRFAAANGQLLLVERDAYARSGGHAATRGYVEDVELAHRLRASGARIALASGADIASVAGYGGLCDNVRGYGRSLYFGCGALGTLLFAAWQLCAFLVPWLLFPIDRNAAIAGIAASVAARTLAAQRIGAPLIQIVQSPAGALLAAIACVDAFATGTRGRFAWRGRQLHD